VEPALLEGKPKETIMDGTPKPPKSNDEQAALWNGVAGQAWVEAQEVLDEMFRPFEALLVEAASAASGGRVLDVGCGAGSTTLAIARRLGATCRCVGVDISAPLVARARARAAQEGSTATFVCDDAQTHAFAPAGFDVILSRFGVMFFDDFAGAFANLRRAARDGAALRLIVWRSPSENPFMTTAERAAAPFLPDLPARRPDAPGQFALADRDRVTRILDGGGWGEIDLQPLDVTCVLPEPELARYLTRLGPVGRILDHADDRTRAQVLATVRAAFDPYVHGAEVRYTAACWMVAARAR
jgi:SAM-dependent methyltransferase